MICLRSDMAEPPRLLITGANGFLGHRVARAVIAEGWRVRAFVRPTSDLRRLEGLPLEWARGDIRDLGALRDAAMGCDGILHLASISRWSEIASPVMEPTIREGTRNVLAAAAGNGGLRTVLVSSATTLGGSNLPEVLDETAQFDLDPRRFPYATAKRAAEAEAFASTVPAVVVNPAEIYGPDDDALITAGNLLDWLKGPLALVCPGGTSVAHVDDVARAIVLAWQRGREGERYFLGGENRTLAQLARLTRELGGRRPGGVISIPRLPTRAAAAVARRLHLPFPVPVDLIPYATRYWFFSAEKARRELGASFRGAEPTLRDTVCWLKETGRLRS